MGQILYFDFHFFRDFKYLRIRFGGVKQQEQEKKDLQILRNEFLTTIGNSSASTSLAIFSTLPSLRTNMVIENLCSKIGRGGGNIRLTT